MTLFEILLIFICVLSFLILVLYLAALIIKHLVSKRKSRSVQMIPKEKEIKLIESEKQNINSSKSREQESEKKIKESDSNAKQTDRQTDSCVKSKTETKVNLEPNLNFDNNSGQTKTVESEKTKLSDNQIKSLPDLRTESSDTLRGSRDKPEKRVQPMDGSEFDASDAFVNRSIDSAKSFTTD